MDRGSGQETGRFWYRTAPLEPGIGPCLQSVSLPMGGVLFVGYFSESGGGVLRFYWSVLGSHRL